MIHRNYRAWGTAPGFRLHPFPPLNGQRCSLPLVALASSISGPMGGGLAKALAAVVWGVAATLTAQLCPIGPKMHIFSSLCRCFFMLVSP